MNNGANSDTILSTQRCGYTVNMLVNPWRLCPLTMDNSTQLERCGSTVNTNKPSGNNSGHQQVSHEVSCHVGLKNMSALILNDIKKTCLPISEPW